MGWLNKYKAAKKLLDRFPDGCKSGTELDWIFKHNCPCCIALPFETLSVAEYEEKYPAVYKMTLGVSSFWLCKEHFLELRDN